MGKETNLVEVANLATAVATLNRIGALRNLSAEMLRVQVEAQNRVEFENRLRQGAFLVDQVLNDIARTHDDNPVQAYIALQLSQEILKDSKVEPHMFSQFADKDRVTEIYTKVRNLKSLLERKHSTAVAEARIALTYRDEFPELRELIRFRGDLVKEVNREELLSEAYAAEREFRSCTEPSKVPFFFASATSTIAMIVAITRPALKAYLTAIAWTCLLWPVAWLLKAMYESVRNEMRRESLQKRIGEINRILEDAKTADRVTALRAKFGEGDTEFYRRLWSERYDFAANHHIDLNAAGIYEDPLRTQGIPNRNGL